MRRGPSPSPRPLDLLLMKAHRRDAQDAQSPRASYAASPCEARSRSSAEVWARCRRELAWCGEFARERPDGPLLETTPLFTAHMCLLANSPTQSNVATPKEPSQFHVNINQAPNSRERGSAFCYPAAFAAGQCVGDENGGRYRPPRALASKAPLISKLLPFLCRMAEAADHETWWLARPLESQREVHLKPHGAEGSL